MDNEEEEVINYDQAIIKIKPFFIYLKDIIFQDKKKSISKNKYIEVYTLIYKLCIQRPPYNLSSKLYNLHAKLIKDYLNDEIMPLLKKNYEDYKFLIKINIYWNKHKIINKWMYHFFSYIDRFYTTSNNLMKLKTVGNTLFYDIIYKSLREKLIKKILELILDFRNNKINEYQLIKDTVLLIESQGIDSEEYKYFEDKYINETINYYNKYSNSIDSNILTNDLLNKINEKYNNEIKQSNLYINNSSKELLNKSITKYIINDPIQIIFSNNCERLKVLLDNNNLAVINNLYKLCKKIRLEDGIYNMSFFLEKYITKKNEEIIQQYNEVIKKEEFTIDLIEKLINNYSKYDEFINTVLEKDTNFNKSIINSFVYILNKEVLNYNISELLSLYCHLILKKNNKIEDYILKNKINIIMHFFSYINDKDIFKDKYIYYFSKRLLGNKLCNEELEKNIISKLKLECGSGFTSSIEGMYNDIKIGKKSLIKYENTYPIDFNVQILTLGYWPSLLNINIKLPNLLNEYKNLFTNDYKKEKSSRKIIWDYSLSNNELTMKINDKKYILVLNTMQICLLFLFNNTNEKLIFDEIYNKLKININNDKKYTESVLKKLLHSLSCGKNKILIKDPKSKKISKNDKFIINSQFKSKSKYIKIPLASLEKSQKNNNQIDFSRKLSIEACIVRIMKSRKELEHNQLISTVIQQITLFKPEIKDIKKSIECLIDKEYIERNNKNKGYYTYLA